MNRVVKTVPETRMGTTDSGPRVLIARMEKLEVGPFEIVHPLVHMYQVNGFGSGAEPDGLICQGFLRRFKLIFDFPHSQLILEPNANYRDGTPFDASGIRAYRVGGGPYRVYDVLDQSPAAEAGLRKGDLLFEVDGRSADAMSSRELDAAFSRAGHDCSVQIHRGNTMLSLKLRLRKML